MSRVLATEFMPRGRAKGQNLGHCQNVFFTNVFWNKLKQIDCQTWLSILTVLCRSCSEGQHVISISRLCDFALYLEDYLMYKHELGINSQYDLMHDLKIKVGHYYLYLMVL